MTTNNLRAWRGNGGFIAAAVGVAVVLAVLGFALVTQFAESAPIDLFTDTFSRGSASNTVGNEWIEQNNQNADEKISSSCGGPNPVTEYAPSGEEYAELRGDNSGTDLVTVDAEIVHSTSTLGYQSVNLSYWRAQRGTEASGSGQDRLVASWRVGSSGPWTDLEDVSPASAEGCIAVDFDEHTFALPGAENLPLIQIRFALIGTSENDKFLVDDVAVTGYSIQPENTLEMCSDQQDNDFDGLNNLDDPDCLEFTPRLTVIKTVDNTLGGPAVASDFQIEIVALNLSSNNFPGEESPGTTVTLDPGEYSVGESGPYTSAYSAYPNDCSGSIAVGESKTCTITNTKLPQCMDGMDNEDPEDDFIDLQDPGCTNSEDNDETDEPQIEECSVAVVSDEDTDTYEEDGSTFIGPAQLLSFIHSAWTAIITGDAPEPWIWESDPVQDPGNDETYVFKRTFDWNFGDVNAASLLIATDNTYEAWLNGNLIGSELNDPNNFQEATKDNHPINPVFFSFGPNTLEVKVTNKGTPNDPNPANNPAGLLYRLDAAGDCTPPTLLTVIKEVNGGTASPSDFMMNVSWYSGGTPIDPFPGADDLGTTFEVNPGTFIAGEQLVPGYAMMRNPYEGPRCRNAEIEAGEHLICTITNTFLPQGGDDYTCDDFPQLSGWYGEYFNYPKSREDMYSIYEGEPVPPEDGFGSAIHGQPVNSGDDAYEWYNAGEWGDYSRFSRVDENLEFGEMFFPFYGSAVEEVVYYPDVDYMFGVHWSGQVDVPAPGAYDFYGQVDDDLWIYVNGEMYAFPAPAPTGVHGPVIVYGTLDLEDGDVIDIYYADRSPSEAAMYFEFTDGDVRVRPYSSECAEGNLCAPQENLLANGGFETPVVTDHGGAWELFLSGTPGLEWITKWFPDGSMDGLAELQATVYSPVFEGSQYAELDTNSNVTMYQDLGLSGDERYNILFAFSPRPGRNAADNIMEVWWNGNLLDTITGDGTGTTTNNWTIYEYAGLDPAAESDTRLEFRAVGTSNSYGTFLDDVCVVIDETPEEPQCAIEGFKYDGQGSPLSDWTIGLGIAGQCTVGDEWAGNVVDYQPGTEINDDNDIDDNRDDPNSALGPAEDDDTFNFVALGFGGHIDVEMVQMVLNGPGPDIEIVETSFGSPSCASYPERADVYASKDGSTWAFLGNICQDNAFVDLDVGGLDWARFVRIQDASNAADFGTQKADGFDVDAVKALNCGSANIYDTEVTDPSGYYCFAEIPEGEYFVFEELQDNWSPLEVYVDGDNTPFFVDSFFDVFVEIDFPNLGHVLINFWNDFIDDDNGGPQPEDNLEACDDDQDNDGDHNIDLADVDCAEFKPTLTVVKEVVGGELEADDFVINVSGDLPNPSSFNGSALGTLVTLMPSAYEVTEASVPEGYSVSYSDDCNGSIGFNEDKVCTVTNTVNSTISGAKFNDLNGDGDWDEEEPGLAGWTIEVYEDVTGSAFVDSTVTGSDGSYDFTTLQEGFYKVCEIEQGGWLRTKPNPDISGDSTPDGCYHFNITHTAPSEGANFGNHQESSRRRR